MNVPVAVGKLNQLPGSPSLSAPFFPPVFPGNSTAFCFRRLRSERPGGTIGKAPVLPIPGKYMSLSLQNLTESQKQSILKIYPDAYEAQLDKLRHERETKMTAEFMRQGEYILEAENRMHFNVA